MTSTEDMANEGIFAKALSELADPTDFIELFVPGRICVIGEHSDWAGHYRRFNADVEKGYCIVSGTNQGVFARVYPHPTKLILRSVTDTGEFKEAELSMNPSVLRKEARSGGFFAYAAGVAYCMVLHYQVRGLIVDNYKTDLPVKKGLSSSAAICVLMARAFNRVYDIKLTVRGEMEQAYLGEIETPSRCGRMDQGCAFGSNSVLMTFDGDHLETEVVELKCQLHLVIVDLKASKDTKEILGKLNRAFPFAESDIERGVHQMLGPINKDLIHRAISAMEKGDLPLLGSIMTEFQTNFDKYLIPACPNQLTAPTLHKVLSYGPVAPLVYGGKGVGSQGDGCAQFLARGEKEQLELVTLIEKDLKLPCLTITLGAAHNVRKAVIPAAGFQHRMFPANLPGTALFPIVDKDGICKPAILVVVEEAICAGIEEVIIVVHPEDTNAYESLFRCRLDPHRRQLLSPEQLRYAERISSFGSRVRIVTQTVPNGFGGAVIEAKKWVGDSPFLLMLSDHIYRSGVHESCVQQLVNAFSGSPLVGMRWTPEKDIARYGTVNGRWDTRSGMLDLTMFVEKPTLEFARRNLVPPPPPASAVSPHDGHIVSNVNAEYLTVFGMYILPPQLFPILEKELAALPAAGRADLPLTPALDRLRTECGFGGLVVRGQRFDFGHPEAYIETLRAFASSSFPFTPSTTSSSSSSDCTFEARKKQKMEDDI